MVIPATCPISDAEIDEHNDTILRISSELDSSKVPHLVCLLLQTYYEARENEHLLPQNNLFKFTFEVIARIINEGWGFVGCLERGAIAAAPHHIRAALELTAGYNWATRKKSRAERRIRKFVEFADLSRYNLFRKHSSNSSSTNKLILKHVTQKDIDRWQGKIQDWCDLFDVSPNRLSDIRSWHYKATIDQLLSEFLENDDVRTLYDFYSHATHLSPVGVAIGGKYVIGIPSKEHEGIASVNMHTGVFVATMAILQNLILDATGYNFKTKFPDINTFI